MGWFSDSYQDQSSQYQCSDSYSSDWQPHQAKLSHELLAGGVAYEAAKAYEDHVAANGHPDSHATAKELFAGFAGAAVDRLAETKGLDAYSNWQDRRQQTLDQVDTTFSQTVTQDSYSDFQSRNGW